MGREIGWLGRKPEGNQNRKRQQGKCGPEARGTPQRAASWGLPGDDTHLRVGNMQSAGEAEA